MADYKTLIIFVSERVKGIEPSSSAWKAVALPLSYTRKGRNVRLRTRDPQNLNSTAPASIALRYQDFCLLSCTRLPAMTPGYCQFFLLSHLI